VSGPPRKAIPTNPGATQEGRPEAAPTNSNWKKESEEARLLLGFLFFFVEDGGGGYRVVVVEAEQADALR
jgi:hypothetical protein